uniref:Uncharacterized protein n=1 Tax=Romanomermis culicivorax TaxID=13658 RepID=A0A915JQ26_ROMCU
MQTSDQGQQGKGCITDLQIKVNSLQEQLESLENHRTEKDCFECELLNSSIETGSLSFSSDLLDAVNKLKNQYDPTQSVKSASRRCSNLFLPRLVKEANDILASFNKQHFVTNYVTTVGVDFKVRTLEIGGDRVKLQIWDTAGQERFRTITSTYYRGTHGVIVVYDVTSQETFDNVKRWLNEIDQNCDIVQRVLVGNKCDDVNNRVVPERDAGQYAARMQVPYFETSAKTCLNVDEMFTFTTQLVLNHRKCQNNSHQSASISNGRSKESRSSNGKSIKLSNKKRHKKKGCC